MSVTKIREWSIGISMPLFSTLLLAAFLMLASQAARSQNKLDGIEYLNGIALLEIVDAETGRTLPGRMEVLGPDGKSYFAKNALPIGGDCGASGEDVAWQPVGYDGTLEDALAKFARTIEDPFTEATHFYSTGESTLVLPPGLFRIKVFKGPEYEIARTAVTIVSGKTLKKVIKLSRFANMPANGWYSADDHVHIARANRGVDPLVLKMMQAEDIHVGNLLQMGRADTFLTTQQYAHGPESQYQEGNYIIASGQENLRTHFFGHTITLGAAEPIYMPDKYLLYRLAWQRAADQGALNGYAHFGELKRNGGPDPGLPLLAPHNLMHFLEVLQFNQGHYDVWYDMLNLGFRITPTAGTDYPCVAPRIPGQERFYTKVDGPLTYERWLDSVRAGKTFITTGPLLEFRINGKEIGSELTLQRGGEVTIKGEVRYRDDDREKPLELELVENGRVVRRFPRLNDSGEINFEVRHRIDETMWLALRTSRGMNIYPSKKPYAMAHSAHSAPIYVTLKNAPPLAEHPRTRAIAQDWLASLDALEARISQENIEYLQSVTSAGDPVPYQILLDNQSALKREIETSRAFLNRFLE